MRATSFLVRHQGFARARTCALSSALTLCSGRRPSRAAVAAAWLAADRVWVREGGGGGSREGVRGFGNVPRLTATPHDTGLRRQRGHTYQAVCTVSPVEGAEPHRGGALRAEREGKDTATSVSARLERRTSNAACADTPHTGHSWAAKHNAPRRRWAAGQRATKRSARTRSLVRVQ